MLFQELMSVFKTAVEVNFGAFGAKNCYALDELMGANHFHNWATADRLGPNEPLTVEEMRLLKLLGGPHGKMVGKMLEARKNDRGRL